MTIAGHVGVTPEGIRPVGGGDANLVWALGDELILRIPRDTGRLSNDLRKERQVIPIARDAGVLTPEIVGNAEAEARLDRPYLVTRR